VLQLLQLLLLLLPVVLQLLLAALRMFSPGTSGVMMVRDLFAVVTLSTFGVRCKWPTVVLLLQAQVQTGDGLNNLKIVRVQLCV
jgi:hypothetical protein